MHLEPYVVHYILISTPAILVTCMAVIFFRWLQRVPLGNHNDPHFWMYGALVLASIYHVALFAFGLFFRRCRCFSGWWELLATVTAVIDSLGVWLVSPWHITVLVGKSPQEEWPFETTDTDFLCILATSAFVNAFAYFSTVRTCRLYIVPVISFLTYCMLVSLVGSPFPSGVVFNILYIGMSCGFACLGCWRHENHHRRKWKATLEVVEKDKQLVDNRQINKAFTTMAGTTSDIVFMMDGALRMVLSDESHEAYFGRSVSKLPFDQLLLEEDRPRFYVLLKAAAVSGRLQSMPASLMLGSGGIQHVQVVIVSTASGDSHKYLVGLHFDSQSPVQEATLALTAHPDAPLSSLCEEVEDTEGGFDDRRSLGTMAESCATTTHTGHLFADLDAALNVHSSEHSRVHQKLRQIAKLGLAEHWLVPPSDLELMPSPELGGGGFSTVLFGRLRGSPVAVKVPRIDEDSPPELLTAMANEIRVNRHVRHANIALFYGACIDPASGTMLLLSELLDGVNLTKYITKIVPTLPGELEPTFRVKVLVDVGSALHYLHSLSPAVVHGDIKGDNVMVERRNQLPHAKLLDFGLSRLRTKQARPLGGTRCWTAPEVFSSESVGPRPQPAADVFSFGWLVYFTTTGTHPKNAVDEEVFRSAAQDDPVLLEPPFKWPARLKLHPNFEGIKALVAECLTFEHQSRPSVAAILERLLTWLPPQVPVTKLGASVVAMLSYEWVSAAGGLEMVLKKPPASPERLADDSLLADLEPLSPLSRRRRL